ncbi:MAG: PDZ domain-containing protein [Oligoflexia bacterium]|nr:PDZ domain-containing protein [Oligoflexia bacterium]
MSSWKKFNWRNLSAGSSGSSGSSDDETSCNGLNLRIYLIGVLVTVAALYLFFGWGKSERTSLNQAGRTPESIRPPETEVVEPPVEVPVEVQAGGAPAAAAPVTAPATTQVDFAPFGSKSTLGLRVGPIDQWNMTSLGLKNNNGAVVLSIAPGKMADIAGLKEGDVIIRLGNKGVNDVKDFQEAQDRLVAGNRYKIGFIRAKKELITNFIYKPAPTVPAPTLAAANLNQELLGWMGLGLQNIDPLMKERLGLQDTKGAIVSYVENISPAADVNFQQGDVVIEVAGRTVRDVSDVQRVLSKRHIGSSIKLTVLRQGKKYNLKVTLTKAPTLVTKPPVLPGAAVETEAAWVGLSLEPLTPAEAEELNLPANTRGMEVAAVNKGAAAKTGIQVGDVIIGINGEALTGLQAFNKATTDANGALLDVLRGGKHLYISIPAPKDPSLKSGPNGKLYQVATTTGGTGGTTVAYKDVAIGAYGDTLFSQVYPNFENAPYFIIYDINNRRFEAINNPALKNIDSTQRKYIVAQFLIDRGVGSVIGGNVERDTTSQIKSEGIDVYAGVFGNINNAITMYIGSKLVNN